MTFDDWWDSSKTTATPETYKGWEESCRQAFDAGYTSSKLGHRNSPTQNIIGTPLEHAKHPNQISNGNAFIGVATALQSMSGIQYMVFAADIKTLQAAFGDTNGPPFDPSMAKPVAIFGSDLKKPPRSNKTTQNILNEKK